MSSLIRDDAVAAKPKDMDAFDPLLEQDTAPRALVPKVLASGLLPAPPPAFDPTGVTASDLPEFHERKCHGNYGDEECTDLEELQCFVESRGHDLAQGWTAQVCRRSANNSAETLGCFLSPDGKRYRSFASVFSRITGEATEA